MSATGADRDHWVGQTARLVIGVSPPFLLDYVVWALRRRAHNDVDRFDAGRYRRVLWLAGEPAEVTVRQDPDASTPSLIAELRGPGGRAAAPQWPRPARSWSACWALMWTSTGFTGSPQGMPG